MYPSLLLIIETFGITNKQILKLFKKLFQLLTVLKLSTNEKCKVLTDILLNLFKNFILHKTQKLDYKTPDWMNRSIILFF